MSVMKRLSMVFRAKANKALDRAEDPRETLDYSYQRQLEMLQKVRRGVADVATSRKRLELQSQQLQQQADKLEKQGRQALAAGREDLAREALTRRSAVQQQQADLATQHAALQGEEEKLTLAAQRLQAKVDAFRTRKETIKATYTAAEAQTKIGEAFSGISEEMGDVGLAVQRAEDKTQAMQARAGAIDELIASGALDDHSGTAKDDLSAELERMSSEGDVELELARLKGELGSGTAPAQLESSAEGEGAAPEQQRQPEAEGEQS
jgi:phage shock protein A